MRFFSACSGLAILILQHKLLIFTEESLAPASSPGQVPSSVCFRELTKYNSCLFCHVSKWKVWNWKGSNDKQVEKKRVEAVSPEFFDGSTSFSLRLYKNSLYINWVKQFKVAAVVFGFQ